MYGDPWRFETHVICSCKPIFRRNDTPNVTPVSQQHTENGAIRLVHCEESGFLCIEEVGCGFRITRGGLRAMLAPEQSTAETSKNVRNRNLAAVAAWFRTDCDEEHVTIYRQVSECRLSSDERCPNFYPRVVRFIRPVERWESWLRR